jgi:transcriptional regulator with XRE-family HTH domain
VDTQGKPVKFGEMVRAARERKGMAPEAFAEAVEITVPYLAGIESGRLDPPSAKVVRRICKVLRMPYRETLARTWWEKRPEDLDLKTAYVIIADMWKGYRPA